MRATVHHALPSGRTSKTIIEADAATILSHVQTAANKAAREVVTVWFDGKAFKGLPSNIRVDIEN
jgi:hypothetical protein